MNIARTTKLILTAIVIELNLDFLYLTIYIKSIRISVDRWVKNSTQLNKDQYKQKLS